MEVGRSEKVGVGSYGTEVRGSSGSGLKLGEGEAITSKEIASSSVIVAGSSSEEEEEAVNGIYVAASLSQAMYVSIQSTYYDALQLCSHLSK